MDDAVQSVEIMAQSEQDRNISTNSYVAVEITVPAAAYSAPSSVFRFVVDAQRSMREYWVARR